MTVEGSPSKTHWTRVSTRWASHWSVPVASAPTHPGVIDRAVTSMVRPRSKVRTWPSTPPRTQIHARVGSPPATDWAGVEPAGQSALATKGIGASPPLGSGATDGAGAATTLIWVELSWSIAASGVWSGRMPSRTEVTARVPTTVAATNPSASALLKRGALRPGSSPARTGAGVVAAVSVAVEVGSVPAGCGIQASSAASNPCSRSTRPGVGASAGKRCPLRREDERPVARLPRGWGGPRGSSRSTGSRSG